MSDFTVSISLTRKEQGALYMKAMRQAEQIAELKRELKELQASAPSAEKEISEQSARFAIDGAIQYGKQGTNKPPTADHWLMGYWLIGRALAEANANASTEERERGIRDAVSYHGRKWPEQLTSGVMFYAGLRITRREFIACGGHE